jgi:hypothetical protein
MNGSIVIIESDHGTKRKHRDAAIRTGEAVKKSSKKHLGAWWEHVAETAIAICPKETGALSRTIRIEKVDTVVSADTKEVFVGDEKNVIINQKIVVGGEIDMITGKDVNYGTFVHDGHISTNGVWVEAQPFLEYAIELDSPLLDWAEKQILEDMGREWVKD